MRQLEQSQKQRHLDNRCWQKGAPAYQRLSTVPERCNPVPHLTLRGCYQMIGAIGRVELKAERMCGAIVAVLRKCGCGALREQPLRP